MNLKPRLSRREALQATGALGAAALLGSHPRCAAMAANSAPLQIIDPHVHVWKNDPRYPWPKELANPPKEDALPSTLLQLMKDHGVEKTVIVHVIHYRWDCRYAGDTIKANPEKFMGVCRVDPLADSAADDLSRWVRDYGFHGVRLSPAAGAAGDWINDRKRMDAIFDRAARLTIPMCILCPSVRLPDVEKVIERHRDSLDVCIDHMADCPIDQPGELAKLLALARFPRVFVKISHLWSLSKEKYPYRDTYAQVKRLYEKFGPQRLMWGTDWPGVERYCGYAKAVALYRDEMDFFSALDRRWILGGTVLKLWPFVPRK
jgi:predicted TIM-barrel fold metal-dependent hydrolase